MKALALIAVLAIAATGCAMPSPPHPVAQVDNTIRHPASTSRTRDARQVRIEVAKQAMRVRCGEAEAVKRKGRSGASPYDYKCKERDA